MRGLLSPSGGSIVLDGRHILSGHIETREQIGVLLADDLLYERQSVQGNLAFHCRPRGLPTGRADEALALVGFSDQAQIAVTRLSTSARRRLAFARAVLSQPRLLLLDQPSLRADLATQELFAHLIR